VALGQPGATFCLLQKPRVNLRTIDSNQTAVETGIPSSFGVEGNHVGGLAWTSVNSPFFGYPHTMESIWYACSSQHKKPSYAPPSDCKKLKTTNTEWDNFKIPAQARGKFLLSGVLVKNKLGKSMYLSPTCDKQIR